MTVNHHGRNEPARSTHRAFLIVLLAGLLLVGVGGMLWFLAYPKGDERPTRSVVPALQHRATIEWQKNGAAVITADTRFDRYAALGYVHGLERTWSIALWRQTALGRLGEWFGKGIWPLDRHARTLGLAKLAKQAYARLPASDQRLLKAYVAGLNAALDEEAASRHDEFALLGVTPPRWKPWHPLAIERLFAWLATTPPSRTDTLSASAAAFFTVDAQFRQWLHLRGFDHSLAWVVREGQSAFLFQRHVHGTSALPLFQEIIFKGTGDPSMTAASLPGTPFLPAGKRGPRAWSLLLSSSIHLARVPRDSASGMPVVYERIRSQNGNEMLLRIKRSATALPLAELSSDSLQVPPSSLAAERDSMTWVVRWTGFRPISDAADWRALVTGQRPSFHLMNGIGLVAEDMNWHVLGAPAIVRSVPNGLVVGQTTWARHQANSLASALRRAPQPDPAALSASDSSTWAAQTVSKLLPVVEPLARENDASEEALTYLRNWNFHYDRASIGASVLGLWLRHYHQITGALPAPADTVADPSRYRQAFEKSVHALVEQFGSDAPQWRWERVNPDRRYFPVWSADSLVAQNLHEMARTRYAPLELPGRGHPSTLSGGSSLIASSSPASAAWAGWTRTTPSAPFMARRDRFHIDAFLGRHTIPERRPSPVVLQDGPPANTTTLVPVSSTSTQ